MKNYNEIFQLAGMLDDVSIPFEMKKISYTNGWQIVYPNYKNRVCSVVINDCSLGKDCGLLEMMGLIPIKKGREDYLEIEGYLTAEDVFNRIQSHYNALIQRI